MSRARGTATNVAQSVGTGPYQLGAWAKGSSITLNKRADYRNAAAIKLSKVTIRFNSDPAAQAAALRCDQRAVCISIPTLASKRDPFVAFRTDGKSRVRSNSPTIEEQSSVGGDEMERSLLIELARDKYVERCKQRAFDHLDRGDLKNAVASFVGNMNARPDCELPSYLATLGALLLTANDAFGWRTLIKGLR